ncbi:MAG: hypothetical protein JXR94_17625 [Candidatus Hydrogenedentes bacterium]|nr:hypothetical protein [Candidatus Hydrogenedentota bacterium]
MRERRGTDVQRPSLFPFLSVLVCLMGVLMFLAVAVALTSLESAASNVALQIEWDSTKTPKQPIYLECTADGARDLESGRLFRKGDEDESVILENWAGTPFTDLLAELASERQDRYIMFVVRPDGLEVFSFLRAVLVMRNKEKCTGSVSCEEEPAAAALEQLPKEIAGRLSYADGKLSFTRAMTTAERDEIQRLFSQGASKQAVEWLFAESQKVPSWVDYGTELIPADWNIQSTGDDVAARVSSPAPATAVQEAAS